MASKKFSLELESCLVPPWSCHCYLVINVPGIQAIKGNHKERPKAGMLT